MSAIAKKRKGTRGEIVVDGHYSQATVEQKENLPYIRKRTALMGKGKESGEDREKLR